MAPKVSPRDVPRDERSKAVNMYDDLAVGDRIKFELEEMGMTSPNAQITQLRPVLVAAVAWGIEDAWEADSRSRLLPRVYCAGARSSAVRQERASEVLDHLHVEEAWSPAKVPGVRRGLREDCDRRTGAKSPPL